MTAKTIDMDVHEIQRNFFLSQLLSKPDTENNKDAFLFDQAAYVCDNKTNQFQKDTQKNVMLNFSYFTDVTFMDVTS